jgi:23S rRNA (uracil1939-C5)-methyltransferase
MAPADLQEVTFDTLTYGGEALGRLPDGRAVFVLFGLPGERARIRLVQEKRGFARGELVEIIQTAAKRITPRCKHFGLCGGCQYQHMPYEQQLQVKEEILRDQLKRIGRIDDPPVEATVPSANPWNYRNQVQFHLTHEGRLGYVRASPDPRMAEIILAIEECHLPQPAINEMWPQLQFERDSGIQRVSIRVGADDDLILTLEGSGGDLPELEIEGELSVTHLFEDDCVLLSGRDHVIMRVLGRDFRVSAPSFFQVNTAMAEKMAEHVLKLAPPAADVMLDVYCGAGLFSAFLAPRCRRLVGIEVAPAACEDFGVNLDEYDNVELYEAPAEDVLPALQARPDLVIVDPPRAGVDLKALDALVQLQPAHIIYVSCDPSTLARDLRHLTDNDYRLTRVTPFDMFPQTYHIESISMLERA